MISKIKPKVEPLRLIIAKPFVRVHPHILSFVGLMFSILFFLFLIDKLFIPALIAFIATAFDMVDGTVARMTKKVTVFGEFLDATLDRISDAFLIAAFGFATFVRWEIIFLVLVTSFLISYMSARAGEAGKGQIKLTAGFIERPERWFFLLAALLVTKFLPCKDYYGFQPAEWLFLALLICSGITIVQRFAAGYRLLSKHHAAHLVK